jgi:hypothetical protein
LESSHDVIGQSSPSINSVTNIASGDYARFFSNQTPQVTMKIGKMGKTSQKCFANILLLLVSFCTLSRVSCMEINAPVEQIEIPKELMPLSVGNKWRYLSGHLGSPDTTIFEITREVTVTIASMAHRAFAYTYSLQGSSQTGIQFLLWNGSDGLYWLGGISPRDSLFAKILGYKYPANAGESWLVPIIAYSESNNRFYVRDTLKFELVGTNEEFETPSGKFDCYVYKYSRKPSNDVSERWDYYDYFSPGVGLVGFISRGQSDQRITGRSVLYDYQISSK